MSQTPRSPLDSASGSLAGALPTRMMLAPREPGGLVWAIVSWLVILAVVGFIVVRHQLERSGAHAAAPVYGRPAVVAVELPVEPPGLFALAGKAVLGTDDANERESLMGLMKMTMRSDADRVRVAVLVAETQGRDAGLAALKQIAETLPESSVLRGDAELMERWIGREGAASAAAPADGATADAVRARHGFYVDLARSIGAPASDSVRAGVLAEGRRALRASKAGTLILLGVGAASLTLFVVGVVKLSQGRLRRAMPRPLVGGSVYLEMFALFLLAFLGLSLLGEVVLMPEWLATIARWSLLLVVLWPVVRGERWSQARAALGWHAGRGVVRELFAGLCGYLACLPIIAMGLMASLSLLAMSRLFSGGSDEGSALPTHPLGDHLARAGVWQTIGLVTLATLWAPIVEEAVFRGALYRHLRAGWSMIVAGLVTSFIFAAIHPQGLFAIPALMSIAMVFVLLREWRGSIIAPMTAHAINNGLIVTVMLVVAG